MVSLGSKSTFLMDLYQFLCPMFHATPCANQNNYYSTLVSVVGLKVTVFFCYFHSTPVAGMKTCQLAHPVPHLFTHITVILSCELYDFPI
jgi:hypothetical protein